MVPKQWSRIIRAEERSRQFSPVPCSEGGQSGQVAQDCLTRFCILGWNLHIYLGCLFHCSITLTKEKVFFLCLNGISCLNLCFLSCHWASLTRAWFPLFLLSQQVFVHMDQSLLFFWLNCPSLSPYDRCFHPLIIFMPLSWIWSIVSLVLGSPTLASALQMWPYQCWGEGKDHFPPPAASTHPRVAQDTFGPLCCQDTMLTQPLLQQESQALLGRAAFQRVGL